MATTTLILSPSRWFGRNKGQPLSSEAKLIGGVGAYDTERGRMLSLTFIFDGRFRNYPPYDNPASRYGAVVEWRHTR